MDHDELGGDPTSDIFFIDLPSATANKQVIEPLAGVLRDPRVFCGDNNRDELMRSVDWLVLADNRSYPSSTRRKMFFFLTKYAERGIEFDQIFVWEAREHSASTFWARTPEYVRAKWEPRLTWYNGIKVTADKNSEHNPVHRIHELCGSEDFYAFKLDIDKPEIETPLVLQLVEDPGFLKELFFKHHVDSALMGFAWGHGHYVNGTFQDSYEIFTSLRRFVASSLLGIDLYGHVPTKQRETPRRNDQILSKDVVLVCLICLQKIR